MQAGFRGERKRELTSLFPSVDLLQSRAFTLVRHTEADQSFSHVEAAAFNAKSSKSSNNDCNFTMSYLEELGYQMVVCSSRP